LGWQFFSFSIWKILYYFLLFFMVWWEWPLPLSPLVGKVSFLRLSSSLDFRSLVVSAFFRFILPGIGSGSWILTDSMSWQRSFYDSFMYFFIPAFFVLSFWTPMTGILHLLL
jgi:hypothetical protein